MYSICIKQHFRIPKNGSYGILIMTKLDGIDESGKIKGLYTTMRSAQIEFEYLAQRLTVLGETYGKTDI